MLKGPLVVCAAFLVLSAVGCHAQLSCNRALELHNWALQELEVCSAAALNQTSPLCDLFLEFEAQSEGQSNSTASSGAASPSDNLVLIGNPVSSIDAWQNYLVQSILSMGTDIGEISYVLGLINAQYATLGEDNTTNEEYYSAWQAPWWSQADTVANFVSDTANGLDPLSTNQLYWKAASYYFAGIWPFPFSQDALERGRDLVDAFKAGAEAHPTWSSYYFNATFNNGSVTAQLPGILITPNASRALPLVVITGGTDYPKEMNVLSLGTSYLQRGYAIVVYDGPGQGEVIRQPPNMPFYPAWDTVLASILDRVGQLYGSYAQMNNVAQAGVSLGGYLSGRACSGVSNRLFACLPNPPIVSVTPTYERISAGIAASIYGPFEYVAEEDPAALPPGYAEDFLNYTAIIDAIFLTCDAASGAPAAIGEAYDQPGPIDPEITYLAGGYGGAVTGDTSELYNGIWQGYRNVQGFGPYPIGDISVPVIGVRGTQDNLLGGQEEGFFAQLSPSVAGNSTLLVFDVASGGALHDQVGSPYILAARTFALLNPMMEEREGSVA